jgi:serine/threonine-protein kinase
VGSLSVGQTLGDRYRIDALLARGGMGSVFKATDTRLSRAVAIKALHSELSADTTEVARFEREARAIAGLHHPGLVQVLDVGREGDVPYLVMEHVPGRTLADLLAKEGKLDPARASDLAEQTLFALSVAHGAGIVHRDIKPGNVMVVPTGGRELVKVLDFGVAQLKQGTAYTRLTQTGAIVGTPAFMAPEQIRGEACDARTDVYAVGVLLWCLLTGRRPFSGKDMAGIVMDVLDHVPARADRLEPGVPAAIATAAEVAMQKRPELRFATASAFASALVDLRASLAPPMARAPMPSPAAPIARPSMPMQAPRAPMPSPAAPFARPSMPSPQFSAPGSTVPPGLVHAPAYSPAPTHSPAPTTHPAGSFGPDAPRFSAPPAPPSIASPVGAPSSGFTQLPAAAPEPPTGISTRTIAVAALGLVSVLLVLVCVIGGLVLRGMESASSPVAMPSGSAAPVAPSAPGFAPWTGTPIDECEAAARCCEVIANGAADCSSLRGLARYGPQATQGCRNALASYRDAARRLGRTCE